MANSPEPVLLLKDLATRQGVRVVAANLYDPTVARTAFDWRQALENGPPPTDWFRHQVKLKVGGLRFVVRANDEYVVVETRDAHSHVAFSVNRPDQHVLLLTKRLPATIGPKRLPAYVAEGHSGAAVLNQVEVLRSIEGLDLGREESLHVARNGILVYVKPFSVRRIIDILNRVRRLVAQMPPPSEAPVDFSDLPGEFRELVPLMKSWAISDDQERSTKLERASTAQLSRLVSHVAPHLEAINRFLDGVHDRAVPDSASMLGTLAECTAEAQLLLANRARSDARSPRPSRSGPPSRRIRKRRP